MLTNMGLSSHAMMELCGAFSLESLHILQITPKSMLNSYYLLSLKTYTCFPSRVLFASIWNKGNSPCPRCLIPLDRVQNLGQSSDRHQRTEFRRVADAVYKRKIVDARTYIYGPKNTGVKSKFVEDILKLDSLVPTSVRIYPLVWPFLTECSERLCWEARPVWVWPLSNVRSWPYAWSWTWNVETPLYTSFTYPWCKRIPTPQWTGLPVSLTNCIF